MGKGVSTAQTTGRHQAEGDLGIALNAATLMQAEGDLHILGCSGQRSYAQELYVGPRGL